MVKSVGNLGIGTYLPENIVANNDLREKLNTSDDWIRSRTGIRERRIAPREMLTADMAYEAGKRAKKNAGILPQDIGRILVATVTPDYAFPSVSCMVQERLGVPFGTPARSLLWIHLRNGDRNALCPGWYLSLYSSNRCR
jgi:3-oxoacyl-[acyl-carrier-protein] synthase III